MASASEMVASLHTLARDHAVRLRSTGVELDKKRLRFNDVVEVGIFYGRVSATFCPRAAASGVIEAIEACVKGSVMETTGPVLEMVQPWMQSATDPRRLSA